MSMFCCPKYPVLRSSHAWKREVRNQIRRLTMQVSYRRMHEKSSLNLDKNSLDKLLQLTPWTLESTIEGSNRVGETSGDVCNTHKIRCWESLPTTPPSMVTHKSRSRMCLESPDFLPNAHTRLKATHTQRQHEDRMRANHMLHCSCTCSLFISRLLEGSSCLMWTPQIHMLSLSLNDFLVMYYCFLLDLLIFTCSPASPYPQGYSSRCYLPDCDFSSLFRAQEKI